MEKKGVVLNAGFWCQLSIIMIKFLIVLEQPDMNSSRRLRYWELSHNMFLDCFCLCSQNMEQIKLKAHLGQQCSYCRIVAGFYQWAWFTHSRLLRKLKDCGRAQEVSLCSCIELSRFPTGSRAVRVWLHSEPSGLSAQSQQLAAFSPREDSKAVAACSSPACGQLRM